MLSQKEDLYKVSVASSVTVAHPIKESCNKIGIYLDDVFIERRSSCSRAALLCLRCDSVALLLGLSFRYLCHDELDL